MPAPSEYLIPSEGLAADESVILPTVGGNGRARHTDHALATVLRIMWEARQPPDIEPEPPEDD